MHAAECLFFNVLVKVLVWWKEVDTFLGTVMFCDKDNVATILV